MPADTTPAFFSKADYMAKSLTITVAATSTAGPFPPSYPPGASGFTAAASNPTGDSAGAISAPTYFGATIVAIANDVAGGAATQLIVALLGGFDQAFLGDVTSTDNTVYPNTEATYSQYQVGANIVTSWIWLLTGAALANSGTVGIANTGDQQVALEVGAVAQTQIDLLWTTIGPAPPANWLLYRGVGSAAPTLYQTLSGATAAYVDTGLTPNTVYNYYVVASYSDGTSTASEQIQVTTPQTGVSETFNCDCNTFTPDGWVVDTLANLRKRVLIRAGYGAIASNPPAGMITTINEYLRTAQNQLYRQHKEFRLKRMYAWQMVPNQRYYGLANDESGCFKLDPLNIDWVGFEDLNQAWYQLIDGIDPLMYTRAQISTGWPTHYEIRSCIEIFPAPKAPYTLWIKGQFGVQPFSANTDTTTIDAEAIYLTATGMYMTDKGLAGAGAVLTQAGNYTAYIVAGQHGTRRYVPRTRVESPMTPPRFLPLNGER